MYDVLSGRLVRPEDVYSPPDSLPLQTTSPDDPYYMQPAELDRLKRDRIIVESGQPSVPVAKPTGLTVDDLRHIEATFGGVRALNAVKRAAREGLKASEVASLQGSIRKLDYEYKSDMLAALGKAAIVEGEEESDGNGGVGAG